MTATVRLACDHQDADGDRCGITLQTGAYTGDAARSIATARGWRTDPDGPDHCPACTGGPPRLKLNLMSTATEETP